jgi:hypothetical protein
MELLKRRATQKENRDEASAQALPETNEPTNSRRKVNPSYSCTQAERHGGASLECCAGELTQQKPRADSALGKPEGGKSREDSTGRRRGDPVPGIEEPGTRRRAPGKAKNTLRWRGRALVRRDTNQEIDKGGACGRHRERDHGGGARTHRMRKRHSSADSKPGRRREP